MTVLETLINARTSMSAADIGTTLGLEHETLYAELARLDALGLVEIVIVGHKRFWKAV